MRSERSTESVALPRTTSQAEAVLTEHVLRCKHCLAMALYRTEMLAEVGCEEYKFLLFRVNAGMELHAGGHIAPSLAEEYCMHQLSAFDRRRIETHAATCHDCSDRLGRASTFISQMKGAVHIAGLSTKQAAAGLRH